MDAVYNKIYSSASKIEPITNEIETEVIHLMCDWAITTRRHGVYRAFFIARLLDRRQYELKTNRPQEIDEKESTDSSSNTQINPFQTALTEYLLKKAPFIDDTLTNDFDMTVSFAALVMLFSEFIRVNLFSPMQFMCNLVAHGLNDNHENNNSHLMPTNHHLYKQPQQQPHLYNPMIRHDGFNMDTSFDRRNTLIDLDPLETMNCMLRLILIFSSIRLLFFQHHHQQHRRIQ